MDIRLDRKFYKKKTKKKTIGKIIFSDTQIPENNWYLLPTGNLLIKRFDEITIFGKKQCFLFYKHMFTITTK